MAIQEHDFHLGSRTTVGCSKLQTWGERRPMAFSDASLNFRHLIVRSRCQKQSANGQLGVSLRFDVPLPPPVYCRRGSHEPILCLACFKKGCYRYVQANPHSLQERHPPFPTPLALPWVERGPEEQWLPSACPGGLFGCLLRGSGHWVTH